MASKKKSWQERLTKSKPPEVKLLDFDFAGLKRGMSMLVSSPQEVAEYIRSIPMGETRSIEQLRADLAAKHQADATCPASTPIFLRVVSEAAFEDLYTGRNPEAVVPFWRVVEPGSRLAQKLTCGDDFLRAQRERER
jgi:hypothetical protein